MNYQRETSHALWSEILPLLKSHYEEIERFQDIPFAPDFDHIK